MEKFGLYHSPEITNELQGFQIKGDEKDLETQYENIFEGIETKEFDELIAEFGTAMEKMPEEFLENVKTGKLETLVKNMTDIWKWSEEKAKQFAIFALITMAASPALASGKEDALRDLGTVRARITKIHTPRKIMIDKAVHLSLAQELRSQVQTGGGSNNIYINGQPAQIIYRDAERTVLGNHDSRYERNGSNEIAVGTIVVEN